MGVGGWGDYFIQNYFGTFLWSWTPERVASFSLTGSSNAESVRRQTAAEEKRGNEILLLLSSRAVADQRRRLRARRGLWVFFSLRGTRVCFSLYFCAARWKRLARPEATSSSSCAEFRETLLFSLLLFFFSFCLCVITQNGSKQF